MVDSIPIVAVFLAFVLLALTAQEIGYRFGRWWQNHTPDEKEGPAAMIVGSLLALLAFLLAITMGMATDRFDARRAVLLAEANSLGTTYLRAGYLPEPSSSEIRNLLREYVALRIVGGDGTDVRSGIERSVELQGQLWSIAERLARDLPESEMLALFIASLNESIDLHETRVTAGMYARVPITILALLLVGSMLTLGMVGYNAGLTRRRSLVTAVGLNILLGATITLVVDLDRPQRGFLQVNQQPMIDLQNQIGPRIPATRPE